MKKKTLKLWAVVLCCLCVFSVSAEMTTSSYIPSPSKGSVPAGTVIESVPGIQMTFGTANGKLYYFGAKGMDTTYNSVTYRKDSCCTGAGENVSMSKNIPTKGNFYKFTAAYNGTLDVVVWARSGKQLYITDQVNDEASAVIYGDYNGQKPSADQVMCFTINAKEGHTYYVFQNSGQMGFFGFTFAGDPDAPFVSPLKNAGLEEGDGGTFIAESSSVSGNQKAPANWTIAINSGWCDVQSSNSNPSQGTKLWNIWSGTVNHIDMYQEITLPRGAYSLSADLRTEKADQVSNQRVYAALRYLSVYSDTLIHKGVASWSGSDAWVTLTSNFYLPKEMKIRVGASSNGGAGSVGWFQIDNFTLTRDAIYDSTLAVAQLDEMIIKANAIKDLQMEASAKESLAKVLSNAESMERTPKNVRLAVSAMDSVLSIAVPSTEIFVPLKAAIDTALAVYSPDAPRTFKVAIEHAQYVYDNGIQAQVAAAVASLDVKSELFIAHRFCSSASDAVDITDLGWIINPTFDTNTNGWTSTTGAQNKGIASNQKDAFTGPFYENWNGSAYSGEMSQTISVPNGSYIVKLAAFTSEGGQAVVFANDQEAASAATATPSFFEVPVTVTDGQLKLGLKITSATWCGIDNASLFVLKSSVNLTDIIAPIRTFDLNGNVATVDNTGELIDALRWDYDTTDVVIELKNNTEDSKMYKLGNDAKKYAAFENLTIKAAEGEKPLVYGSFVNVNMYKMDNFIFEDLTFMGDTANVASSGDKYSPICNGDATKDTVNNLVIRNCAFNYLSKEQVLRIRSGVWKNVTFEACSIDNYGWKQQDGGNHAFQFNKGNVPTVYNFTLKESFVSNYQGKQFINFSNIKPLAGSDSTITITVENNTFYKFSGNGWWNKKIQYRNFVELTGNKGYKEANVNINNNFFYGNYADTLGIANRVALFAPDATHALNVSLQNNVFAPDNVMYQVETGKDMDSCNLPIYGVKLENALRNNILLSELDSTFVYDPAKTLSFKSKLFTAGLDGKYVGMKSMYYIPSFTETKTGAIVENVQQLIEALAYDEYDGGYEDVTIELKNSDSEDGFYRLGSNPKKYAAFESLTIKAFDGEKPVIIGTFTNANQYVMNFFTFQDLTFMGDTANVAASADKLSPICNGDATKDTVNSLIVENCAFNYLSKEQVLRIRSGVWKNVVFAGCTIDNYGWMMQDGGNHAFQFNKGTVPTVGAFTLTESVISNYQGKQFINFSNIVTSAAVDSMISVTIDHNTFYKFSGNGWWNNTTQYRNFLELPKNFGNKISNVNISNNLFYENYADTLGIANRLALFAPDATHALNVSVLNNVFAPDSVMYQVEAGKTMDSCNLPVYGVKVDVNRKDLYMSDFDGLSDSTFWANEENLTIYKTSPLYTAGVEGTYVGAKASYVKNLEGLPVVAYFVKEKDMDATATKATNDPIYQYLAADDKLNVQMIAITEDQEAMDTSAFKIDFSGYDVAVIQQGFSSSSKILSQTGALSLIHMPIPTLYNHVFAMRSDRAIPMNSKKTGGKNPNPGVVALKVLPENQAWGLFNDIKFDADSTVVLFNRPATDAGIEGVAGKAHGISYALDVDNTDGTLLGYPAGVETPSGFVAINYIKAGNKFGGSEMKEPLITFAMNFGAICADGGKNVTYANLVLWKNAVYNLAGLVKENPRNLVGLKKIGYFTKSKDMIETAATVENDPIYSYLKDDDSLNVVLNVITDASATATADLAGYDAIVIQESFGGGDGMLTTDGALALSKINVPFLYNKNYAMKSGRALASGNGGGKEASGIFSITLDSINGSRALFSGLIDTTKPKNGVPPVITLFTLAAADNGESVGDKAVKALNYAEGVSTAGTLLASPTGVKASIGINYIKAGEKIEDQTLAANAITMGQNFGAICALNGEGITDANFKLWKNAVYVLSGIRPMDIFELGSLNAIAPVKMFNNVFAKDGSIYVNMKSDATINVYDVQGSLVRTIDANEGLNTINGLNRGLYIIRANSENVKVVL